MRKKIAISVICTFLLSLCLCGAAIAAEAEVLQGKTLEFNKEAKTLTIEEYDLNFDKEFKYGHPTGIQSTVDLTNAQVGIEPAPGDIVRIAYYPKGDVKDAIKVQNMTKQNLMKK
ncbi:MAG: hypothetical protein PHV85_08695 [Desulfovibrionaceae bacterium]|nr:hypothetical protein [Desulfovibrionaceae bacterium]